MDFLQKKFDGKFSRSILWILFIFPQAHMSAKNNVQQEFLDSLEQEIHDLSENTDLTDDPATTAVMDGTNSEVTGLLELDDDSDKAAGVEYAESEEEEDEGDDDHDYTVSERSPD